MKRFKSFAILAVLMLVVALIPIMSIGATAAPFTGITGLYTKAIDASSPPIWKAVSGLSPGVLSDQKSTVVLYTLTDPISGATTSMLISPADLPKGTLGVYGLVRGGTIYLTSEAMANEAKLQSSRGTPQSADMIAVGVMDQVKTTRDTLQVANKGDTGTGAASCMSVLGDFSAIGCSGTTLATVLQAAKKIEMNVIGISELRRTGEGIAAERDIAMKTSMDVIAMHVALPQIL